MNRHKKRNRPSRTTIATGTLALLLMVATLVIPSFAHDLYLLPDRFRVEAGMLLRIGLHNGDSFPESEVSPALERVRDMRILSATGKWNIESLHIEGKSVRGQVPVPGGSGWVATARTVPHTLQLPALEFETYLKEEGLANALAWRKDHRQSNGPGRERYAKYAKSLLTTGAHNEFHTEPVGFALEFVPERSPYDLAPPADLVLHLLHAGKPAADVQVESSWARPGGVAKTTIAGRTDKDGRIVVPLEGAGTWRIHGVWIEPCKQRDIADWESSWASLTFQIQ